MDIKLRQAITDFVNANLTIPKALQDFSNKEVTSGVDELLLNEVLKVCPAHRISCACIDDKIKQEDVVNAYVDEARLKALYGPGS